jgi:hypothetical protein
MSRAATLACVLVIVSVGAARAQAPTGVIAGMAVDSSGAALVGREVHFVNRETGSRRIVMTAVDGHFAAEALLPGEYQVSVESAGFKRLERTAVVEAGSTTTVDLVLQVGDINETVVVIGATPQLDHDHHQVDGLVGRAQIDSLPLNGRNFLELAKLEPGVTSYVRLNDNRAFVSILGAGLQTIPRARDDRWGQHRHARHRWRAVPGIPGRRPGISTLERQLRSGHEPGHQRCDQYRDPLRRE